MLSLSHTEAACYIAGFFDGEAYFGIKSSTQGGLSPRVTVTNTHIGVLLLLKEILCRWGVRSGNVNKYRRTAKGNRKECFYLELSTHPKNIKLFLQILTPYLIIKSEQAKLIMQFCDFRLDEGRNYRKFDEEETLIYLQLRMMNRRGK